MLEVDRLSVRIGTQKGPLTLVENVSFSLPPGGTLGIVGESGSGKSMLALAIMGLLPEGARATGSVALDGRDLLTLDEEEMCRVRGAAIGMVFQEPMSALNPAMRIGDQIAEGIRWHKGTGRRRALAESLALLQRVRFPDPRRRLRAYPHELSGGQLQRVGIAIALALRPRLLIADEPTTALDPTIQIEVLDLLSELVAELGMALIVISHDLGVIAAMAEHTLVMYAGTSVEAGKTDAVLGGPAHPYTQGLLAAVPSGGPRSSRLSTIPGVVPPPDALPPGCRFSDRCAFAIEVCGTRQPDWVQLSGAQGARCVRATEQLR